MTATEYIETLGLVVLKPTNEEHAIDMLIFSHKNQRQMIREQLKIINSVPKWILKWFTK